MKISLDSPQFKTYFEIGPIQRKIQQSDTINSVQSKKTSLIIDFLNFLKKLLTCGCFRSKPQSPLYAPSRNIHVNWLHANILEKPDHAAAQIAESLQPLPELQELEKQPKLFTEQQWVDLAKRILEKKSAVAWQLPDWINFYKKTYPTLAPFFEIAATELGSKARDEKVVEKTIIHSETKRNEWVDYAAKQFVVALRMIQPKEENADKWILFAKKLLEAKIGSHKNKADSILDELKEYYPNLKTHLNQAYKQI